MNLRPNAETGKVVVDITSFPSTHCQLTILAIDDYTLSSYQYSLHTTVSQLEERITQADISLDTAFRDIRLYPSLDNKLHFTEHYLISLLQGGESKIIEDIKTSTVESYDSIVDVYNLYMALTKHKYQDHSTLKTFDFLPKWKSLSDIEKSRKYDEYACHELNIFIYKKDKKFFDSTIAPYLRNKLQLTFIDQYLLQHDLSSYVQPHLFKLLNVFEKLLLAECVNSHATSIYQSIIDEGNSQDEDQEIFIQLFKAALQTRSLSNKDSDVIPQTGRESKEERKKKQKVQEANLKADIQLQAMLDVKMSVDSDDDDIR